MSFFPVGLSRPAPLQLSPGPFAFPPSYISFQKAFAFPCFLPLEISFFFSLFEVPKELGFLSQLIPPF